MYAKKNSQKRTQKYSLYKKSNVTDDFIKVKHRGKIYTPDYLVEIILDRGDYFGENILKKHNLDKYVKISVDNPDTFFHTSDKTLIVLLNLKERPDEAFINDIDYAAYYLNRINENDLITYSKKINDVFGDSVILNNYEDYIKRTVFISKGKTK